MISISEAHLNDYKIRLKKRKITDNEEYVNSPKPQTNTTPTVGQLQQQQQPPPPLPPQSMLANSYHNYSMLNTYVPPTQPVLYYAAGQVPDTSLTQKICTALIATKEKPKNYDKNLCNERFVQQTFSPSISHLFQSETRTLTRMMQVCRQN